MPCARTLSDFSKITLFTLGIYCAPPSILYAAPTEDDQNVPMEEVQRFSNAIAQIKQYYVKPVSDRSLFENAIRGMLAGLDPHSNYLDEHEFNELQTATSGEFGGLGLEVTLEDGAIKVISPIAGGPADKGHLKSGDYIVKINSKAVQGLDLKDAVASMRGKIGEPVTLTIIRKHQPKPFDVTLVRENIQIKSVQTSLLEDHYGYVRLTQFQTLTAQDMQKGIEQLKEKAHHDLRGLILDLRNNPGGLLDSAIQIADAFIDTHLPNQKQDIIVYTEGRLPGSKFTAIATPGDILNHAPIVVLINGGSASASEIVAGALKDNKRALIVGTRSFGKGTVQTVLPLDNTHGIKLTTALYFTPSGTSIQAQGITPDIEVQEISLPNTSLAGVDGFGFTEADLKGHLQNATPHSAEPTVKTEQKTTLMHQDYQLYEGLTILKSLVVAKQ